MAGVLRRVVPDVRVEQSDFETFATDARFDVIYAAQSWHWVDGARGFPHARSLLRAAGLLALFWNRPCRTTRRCSRTFGVPAPVGADVPGDRVRGGGIDVARVREGHPHLRALARGALELEGVAQRGDQRQAEAQRGRLGARGAGLDAARRGRARRS